MEQPPPFLSVEERRKRGQGPQHLLLFAASLEAAVHQLLYQRRVYPRDAFGPVRFLGLRCRACRHPGVAAYVRDFVAAAGPAVLVGAAAEVRLVVCEAGDDFGASTRDLETYVLRLSGPPRALPFSGGGGADAADDGDVSEQDRRDDGSRTNSVLEGAMRDLLLRVLGMPSDDPPPRSDSASFRLVLRVPERDASCPELDEGFSEGSWISSDPARGENSKTPLIRPIYQASTAFGDLTFLQELTDGSRREAPASGCGGGLRSG
jgi:mitotic spindle assembly checkpoint protein MAD2B